MNKLDAVIFDMDGTLLDSEPIFLKADLAVIAAYGGFMTPEEHDKYIGMGAAAFIPMIKKMYNIEASCEEIRNFQERTYLEIARNEIHTFPRMIEFARWCRDKGLPIAIASGSTPGIIEEMTEITGIRDLFENRISSVEVEKGKPHPDVFLEAARRLGVRAENCLVMEDSPFGIEAAFRAGMRSIAVPPPVFSDPDNSFSQADYLFEDGMNGFSCEKMIAWVEEHLVLPVLT